MSIPGSNIRTLRKQLNISIRAFSEATGIERGNLSRIETGKVRASQDVLERIAAVLHVSVGVLFADPEVVEAAALNMRQVRVFTLDQMPAWKGPDDDSDDEEMQFLHIDMERASRYVFAIRVTDGANLPRFQVGDELIFDARKVPQIGQFVVAVEGLERAFLGRFRPLPAQGNAPMFEVLPLDPVYPVGSSVVIVGLTIRGTLVESRRIEP